MNRSARPAMPPDHVTPAVKPAVSTGQKRAAGSLTALAAAVIAVLTTQGVVHWTSSQTTLVTTATGAAIAFAAALYKHLERGTKAQPVALAATFTALVSATLALGTGFAWWHLGPEQISALMALVTAFIGVAGAWIARGQVVAGTTGDGGLALRAATAAAQAPTPALAALSASRQVDPPGGRVP